jgi:putative heme-binding domain-containing protein
MTPPTSFRLLVLSLTLATLHPLPAAGQGLRVPEGFEVVEYADNSLATNIYCLTLDSKGRVIVSGPGYVRLLLEGPDGKATRAVDFAGAPKDGAMGLCWDGGDLLAVGGGGLLRWSDADGPGRDKPPQLLFACKTGGEHDSHAIRRGPDGWLYLLCGNHARIPDTLRDLSSSLRTLSGKSPFPNPLADKTTSPLKAPVAGCVLRFPPDFRGVEVVADGFRNAYGMDFNGKGELFTFDSDNERCVSLPWYEFTRCYHVVPGGHYGWRAPQLAESWRLPPAAADVVPPLATLGRGSPTGVICYKHTQFPARYRGGLFLLDWTFGQVWFVSLTRSGSTWEGKPERFLTATGENGFAPTAAAVHPGTGDLFLSIGGRGTRGAVYRIRYRAGLAEVRPAEVAALQPAAHSLDWHPDLHAGLLEQAGSRDLHVRRRALDDLRRHRNHFSPAEVAKVLHDNAGEPDRLIRQAAAALLADLPREQRDAASLQLTDTWSLLTRHLANPGFGILSVVQDSKAPWPARREAARLLQLALGDVTAPSVRGTVWEGYTRRTPVPEPPRGLAAALRRVFPSGDPDLDREVARLWALLADDDPKGPEQLATRWTERSDPIDDLHYLIVLGRLPAPRSETLTRQTASALLALDQKIEARKTTRDSHWPLRLGELHAGLAARDPRLNRALLEHPAFGRPDHVVFTHAPGFDRKAAAERFLAIAARNRDFAWNAELIGLLGEAAPERVLPLLRSLWGEAGLDEAILPVLARHARPEDRDKLRSGLSSPRLSIVRVCLSALERLPAPTERDTLREETLALIKALRQVPAGKEEDALRTKLSARLRTLTGQKRTTLDEWVAWCRTTWPERAVSLLDIDGVDLAGWQKRLAGVDWEKGDVKRGSAVYVKASCASCHSGAQALGPDLVGVAGRFSRADLFTAIVQPSKDVSARYRTTLVSTHDGKTHQGLIVYEATDSLLLLTGPGSTVRLTPGQIAEKRATAVSLMPPGLLDRASNQDLADLYAYLKSLSSKGRGKTDRE